MLIETGELNKRIKDYDDKLFLLYGEEDYFIDMAVLSIKKKYLASGFEQMDYVKLDFNGKNPSLNLISDNLDIPSWSSLKRIVEVRDFAPDKDTSEKLCGLVKNVPDGSVLLFVNDTFDKRKKKLYDSFVKYGIVCELKHLDEFKLTNYIRRTLGRPGLNIDNDACESIISRYDLSMRRIELALKRIILYAMQNDIKVIDMAVVDDLCEPDIHANIFKIMDAVGGQDAAAALILLDNLIKLKEPLPGIRFMIARHFRELICAKQNPDASFLVQRLKVRDFNARKLINQSRRFSMDKLLKLYGLCFTNDYDLKHGEADERRSLESFIVLASAK